MIINLKWKTQTKYNEDRKREIKDKTCKIIWPQKVSPWTITRQTTPTTTTTSWRRPHWRAWQRQAQRRRRTRRRPRPTRRRREVLAPVQLVLRPRLRRARAAALLARPRSDIERSRMVLCTTRRSPPMSSRRLFSSALCISLTSRIGSIWIAICSCRISRSSRLLFFQSMTSFWYIICPLLVVFKSIFKPF